MEAPNWTPDGKALIINGDGLIWRVALDDPKPVKIDTGFAVKCNNDHGLSPDGQTLIISDHSEFGESAIYTLPVTGGVPKRITEATPSYWHGVSPDGGTLAFVARRNGGPYDVHTIPAHGGAEVKLTQGFQHTDGCDYTPDGTWIWFNGQKEGRMQLWRIRPDGSDPQQMTDQDRWHWFPHPSPDGRHVVYLTYDLGTEGHPRDKWVDLRLIPSEGGEGRILTRLFGGQGTINVGSWAPDSKRFAYMEYDPT
jgi:Tol biopolymer transport system component